VGGNAKDWRTSNNRLRALEAQVARESQSLTEAQWAALEKAKGENEAHGEFASECPGYWGGQATFYVGPLKGVGRSYQPTVIDTYSKGAFAKLYDCKTSLTAADLLTDQVGPFFEEHEGPWSRLLPDRGTEYWGSPDSHEYEVY